MSFVSHTINTPAWLTSFMNDVLIECIVPMGFIGRVGYRYWEPEDPSNPSKSWLIVAYPTPNVIRGSNRNDGTMFVSGFQFNVSKLIEAMTDVEEVVWSNPVKYNGDMDGPELSVRGVFNNKHVWLRFFHMPPSDEPPGFAVNPQTSESTELPLV